MQKIDPLISKLFELKAYIGHRSSRVHPKAEKMFVFKNENKISLIDLTKTVSHLKKAKEYAYDLGKQGKVLLFVGTKKNIAEIIKNLCLENNLMYITTKWPPGLLTNFETIKKNIDLLRQMKKEKEEGNWDKFPKHERIKLQKKLNKLLRIYGGIENLENLPDAIYLVDLRKERNAIRESKKLQIPTIGITDTNVDPTLVDYPIPANDDYPQVVEFITQEIIKSYLEGQKAKK